MVLIMSLKPPKLPPIESQSTRTEGYDDGPIVPQNTMSTSYKLTGNATKHVLPAQRSLQPNQDTRTGEIETWPAYASRSVSDTGLITSSFSKEMSVLKKNTIPKPKFLTALETYVRKEIVQLGCTDPYPSELRLQAYREVFEYLIEDFKTYKPLLSQIKNEYEKMLSYFRQRIHELEPLKAMLITVSEQCDQKILKIREEERQEIMQLKKNKMDLLKYIDDMKEKEVSLNAQIAKLQQDLSIEYRKYRNECDMRKLLISDMNDLRHQQEDLKRAAGQGVIDADDDPVRLKLALKVAKEDLERQAQQLIRIQADYGDVVPRRDFQLLEAKYAELEEKLNVSTSDFDQLKEEHDTMLEVHKQVLEQRDQFFTEAETLRRSATPRPKWRKFGDLVPAGPDYWHELTTGKTSEQIVEALLNEFKNAGPQGPETFEGRGPGEEVPKFLRYEGTIRNRRLTKAELNTLMKDIWAKKVASDAEKGTRQKMADYLHTFFLEKFSMHEEMAAEWGYSAYNALTTYQDLSHFKLALDIVNDEASEDAYYRQMDIIKKLMTELDKIDTEKTDRLMQSQFATGLNVTFPLKTEASISALVASALQELETAPDSSVSMEYKALFTEDEEGHTGPFINLLREQDEEERNAYLGDLVNQLEGVDSVPVKDLRETIMIIDPTIDQLLITSYLQVAFKCERSELDDAQPVEKSIAVERLRKGGVHRAGVAY